MWLSDTHMADSRHNPDVVDKAEVAAFLKSLRGDMTNQDFAEAAGLPYPTAQKWFTVNVGEVTAVNFLKAVIGMGAEDVLAQQIRAWRKGRRLAEEQLVHPDVPPLPPTAIRRVAEPEPSGQKKRGTR